RTAHHLRKLLRKPGWHLRGVGVDHVAAIVILHTSPCEGDHIGGGQQYVSLLVGNGDPVPARLVQQLGNHPGQLVSHLHFGTGVADGAPAGGLPAVVGVHAYDYESVAHRGDDVVRSVPCGGDRTDYRDSAGPVEAAAAVGTDVA